MIFHLALVSCFTGSFTSPASSWTKGETGDGGRSPVTLVLQGREVYRGEAYVMHPTPQWTSLTNRFPIPFDMQKFITFDRKGEIIGEFEFGDTFDPRNLVLSGDWIYGRFFSAWTMGGALYSSDPSQKIAVFDGKSSKPVASASPIKVGHPVAVWKSGQALFILPTQAMLQNKRRAEKITFQVRDSMLRLIETYVTDEKQSVDTWMELADDSANWRPVGELINLVGRGQQERTEILELLYGLTGKSLIIKIIVGDHFRAEVHRLLATRVGSK